MGWDIWEIYLWRCPSVIQVWPAGRPSALSPADGAGISPSGGTSGPQTLLFPRIRAAFLGVWSDPPRSWRKSFCHVAVFNGLLISSVRDKDTPFTGAALAHFVAFAEKAGAVVTRDLLPGRDGSDHLHDGDVLLTGDELDGRDRRAALDKDGSASWEEDVKTDEQKEQKKSSSKPCPEGLISRDWSLPYSWVCSLQPRKGKKEKRELVIQSFKDWSSHRNQLRSTEDVEPSYAWKRWRRVKFYRFYRFIGIWKSFMFKSLFICTLHLCILSPKFGVLNHVWTRWIVENCVGFFCLLSQLLVYYFCWHSCGECIHVRTYLLHLFNLTVVNQEQRKKYSLKKRISNEENVILPLFWRKKMEKYQNIQRFFYQNCNYLNCRMLW